MYELDAPLPLPDFELRPRLRLEWTAQHLRHDARPVHSWNQVRVLIGHVGTTEWPWLTVQSTQASRRRRRAICAGFADILTVDVSDLDASGRARNVRRLGFGAPVDRWIDLGPHLEPCPPVRQFQVLSPPIATVAFKEWLELGRTDTFSCEDV
jgi:hypothetical protein